MGQYYRPVLKKTRSQRLWNTTETAWDFGDGAKLMEHSYIGNSLVEFVKGLIFNNPMRVVWAGDYANNERGKELNLYDIARDAEEHVIKRDSDIGKHAQEVSNEAKKYLCNMDKKLYVDYRKVKEDDYGFRIDPLPLLTAEGNGRGGGDYRGTNKKLVGSWARNFVYVTDTIPEGYTELVPSFRE